MKEVDDFLTNPRLLQHYSLLKELGVFEYADSLRRETRDYEALLAGAAAIFKRTAIDDLLETTVKCISDKLLPSFLVFLWRTHTGREDIVVKGYRNFKETDVSLPLWSIAPFDEFFRKYPTPISYELFEYQFDDPALTQPFLELRPEIVVPVIGPSGLYGMILVGSKVLEDQYTPRELAFLDKLMAFASIAIQNHLHYEHSVRDQKTGLFNHGYFMVRLHEEIARAKRGGLPFSVIVLDVDKFKTFNDGFGHMAGDRVLEKIAESLRSKVRDGDVLARFGGEEFTVLLPESDREQAWNVSERLRIAVAETEVPWDTPLPRVTISSGVATFNNAIPVEGAELLRRADDALYGSKERGRNRTTIWGAGLLFRTKHFIGEF
ncbi:MAG: diguanylate cyclase [Treponema sp. GWB1_62_6]|nr:MAG: diguanylate cyclase [Treponema sp. GWB1_62_6]OHE68150.1 MAG: diguanylate cyclase [Treponema sp. RIFOXYC1_FULL_61_9]OHE70042.1 MAG: diguanylate cyclase [Treponema sp. GWC1_61_84]HCM25402.1 GGDEF domain-containing protein [Treponema sp.]